MAKERVTASTISTIIGTVSGMVKFPCPRYFVDYDEEADVLYIGFQRPQKATDTVMREDGVLLRYRGENLVGITVLDASKR